MRRVPNLLARTLRLVAILATLLAAAPLSAKPVEYELLPSQSRVGFTWSLGTDRIRGEMPVSTARIVIDFERVAHSSVQVEMDVSRARAGFPFADQAMKGPKVLWSDRFPSITFRSTSVRPAGKGRAAIEGDLTIRGVTRRVLLDATLYRPPGTTESDLDNLTIKLGTTVSRSAFGADGWPDMVSDEVRLEVTAAIRASG